jgi:hypothetical protein
VKKASLFLTLLLIGILASAQSITFNRQTIEWDDQALVLESQIGKTSTYKNIHLRNRTPGKVTAKLHTHSPLNFVWFTANDGEHYNDVTITLGPNESAALDAFIYLKTGAPKIYNEDLGFDIYYNDKHVGYVEMDLTAYFYSPSSGGGNAGTASRPPGYEAWTPLGSTPMRPKTSDLPLKVYSNHASYIHSNDFEKTVRRSINIWNAAGKSIGLGKNIFKLTASPSNADFDIDWSGRGLPSGALGAAKLAGCNSRQCYIDGISMLPPTTRNLGQTCEILIQELGHLLGLGHSGSRDDIMNGSAHGHWHDLSEVDITARDRQMLQWLFSLTNYVPLRPGK